MTAFVGAVVAFAGEAPPPGWLMANGSNIGALSDPILDELKQVLGERFNLPGERLPICRLPSLAGRAIVSSGLYDEGADGGSDGTQIEYRLGQAAGRAGRRISLAQMPRHAHRTAGGWHPEGAALPDGQPIGDVGRVAFPGGGQLGSFWEYPGYMTSAIGGSEQIDFRSPVLTLNYVICYSLNPSMKSAWVPTPAQRLATTFVLDCVSGSATTRLRVVDGYFSDEWEAEVSADWDVSGGKALNLGTEYTFLSNGTSTPHILEAFSTSLSVGRSGDGTKNSIEGNFPGGAFRWTIVSKG